MTFKSLPFESESDFTEMMPALWDAFENPFNPFLRVVFYLEGNSPEERVRSVANATAGTLALHKMNPNSHWMKVLHNGTLIGAVNWIFNKENPYTEPEEEPVVAVWWPEGAGRDYASNYLEQIESRKSRLYNRPHAYLNISFTVPEWRRHGAGNLMMEWGVKEADRMGLESFVEASAEGKCLYEKWGFLHFDTLSVNTKIHSHPSAEWQRLERELSPSPQYLMWRPMGGIFEPGKTTLPWETEPFIPK